jgi:tetratricopeptide (TPR) repeat protein
MKEKIKQLTSYLSQDPSNVSILIDLSFLYLEIQEFKTVKTYIEQGRKIAPEHPQFYYLDALTLLSEKNYAKALPLFEHLNIEGSPDSNILYNCAYCCLQLSQPEKALPYLEQATLLTYQDNIALLLGRTQYQLGDFKSAIDTLTQLCEAFPDNAEGQGMLAQVYIDFEQWELSEKHAIKALSLDPANNAAAISLAYIHLQNNQFTSAQHQFELTLAQNNNSGRSLLGLAIIAVFHQRFDEAEQHLWRVLKLQPNSLSAINLLGWIYILLDRFEHAKEIFMKGIDIDRTYSEMYGGLAIIDVILANNESARVNISRSLRLNTANFSGNFAKILMLQNDDKVTQAEKVWGQLMASPIDVKGQTLEQAIITQLKDLMKTNQH